MDLDICIGPTEAASVEVLCLQVGYCRSTAVSCHCFFFLLPLFFYGESRRLCVRRYCGLSWVM